MLMLASTPTLTSATAAELQGACADVLFIGARGSGQSLAGTLDDGGTGMGPQTYGSYNDFVSGLGGRRTVDLRVVQYPAEDVGLLPFTPSEYFAGLEAGVGDVNQLLAEAAVNCPEQRLVLAGYSQGAMVMHRVIQRRLAANRADPVLARVDGGILIADGDRVRRDNTRNLDSAPASAQGVGQVYSSLSGASSRKLTKTMGDKVFSICRDNDPVCDNNGGLPAAWDLSLHTDSYTNTPVVRSAAFSSALNVRATPAHTPRFSTLRSPVGEPVAQQLTADVLAGYTLEWRVFPGSLPPGTTMSSSGLISGTPTLAGQWSATAQVRAIQQREVGVWVSRPITWDIVTELSESTLTVGRTSGPAGFWTDFRAEEPCPEPVSGYQTVVVINVDGTNYTNYIAQPEALYTPRGVRVSTDRTKQGTTVVEVSCQWWLTNAYDPKAITTVTFDPIILTSTPPVELVAPQVVHQGETITVSANFPADFPLDHIMLGIGQLEGVDYQQLAESRLPLAEDGSYTATVRIGDDFPPGPAQWWLSAGFGFDTGHPMHGYYFSQPTVEVLPAP